MAWKSVAICDDHWKEEEGDRTPVRAEGPKGFFADECYRCGALSSILVRRDIQEEEEVR